MALNVICRNATIPSLSGDKRSRRDLRESGAHDPTRKWRVHCSSPSVETILILAKCFRRMPRASSSWSMCALSAAIQALSAYCTSPKTAAYQWTHYGTLGLSAPMSPLLSPGSGKGLPKLLFQNLAGRVTQLPKNHTRRKILRRYKKLASAMASTSPSTCITKPLVPWVTALSSKLAKSPPRKRATNGAKPSTSLIT